MPDCLVTSPPAQATDVIARAVAAAAMMARSHWLVWGVTGGLAAAAMGGYVLTRTVSGLKNWARKSCWSRSLNSSMKSMGW